MDFQTIYLFDDDDIVSINDQLARSYRKQVLFVVSNRLSKNLSELDLIMLRRSAARLEKEFGIATGNPKLRQLAKQIYIPVFSSEESATKDHYQWRVGRRSIVKAGVNPVNYEEISTRFDLEHQVIRRKLDRPGWRTWVGRYATILSFFVASALIFVGIAYAIPGATVTIQPNSRPITIDKPIIADPNVSVVGFESGVIPARSVSVTLNWQTEVETSGAVEVASVPSRGRVVFTNKLDQAVVIPAGTLLRTLDELGPVYQTISSVTAPGVVGGTVEVGIVALEPGPTGNVAADAIQRIDDSLAIQLSVRNPTPTDGGEVEPLPAVSQADLNRLRDEVLSVIQTLASGKLDSLRQENEFVPAESIIITEILSENYSHQVDQRSDTVSLRIEAVVSATAINPIPANDIVYTELIQSIDPDHALDPNSFQFSQPRVVAVDPTGRVELSISATGTMLAQLDLERHLETIAGQEIELAMAYLDQQLPLAEAPTARVVPNWFNRLPYLPTRIEPIFD